MEHAERSGWIGEYEIIILHEDGRVEKESLKNRITNAGLNMIRDGLKGSIADVQLKYLAVGTSAIAVDDAQTQLGVEGFRTTFVSKVDVGTGQLRSTAILLDSEAVFHIQELGIFAGPGATGAANSGILVSRILYDRNKTNLESIQFVRTDTIMRG